MNETVYLMRADKLENVVKYSAQNQGTNTNEQSRKWKTVQLAEEVSPQCLW